VITAKEILQQVSTLPPLPDTAVKLMQVINDPLSTVDEIVEAIKYDQAITGEVLRLCNSAYFGMSRKVTSLNDAMLCLGTTKVMQLVMSVHTSSVLSGAQHGYGLDPGLLWKHSVAVALASAEFAQRVKTPNGGSAFTAGLLHDVGKVVLNEYVAEEFIEIVRRVNDEKTSFLEAEQQVLGFSHVEIGEKIANAWQLPDPIVQCIRYHHEPHEATPPEPLVDIMHLADCTCMMLGIGIGADGLAYRADDSVMERHNLVEGDLEAVGAQTLVELKRVEKAFSDQSPSQKAPQPVGK
jgi:putative nucleotidyltransferase with HDIG domain